MIELGHAIRRDDLHALPPGFSVAPAGLIVKDAPRKRTTRENLRAHSLWSQRSPHARATRLSSARRLSRKEPPNPSGH